MRHTVRGLWLLWLCLLLSIFVVKYVNAEDEPLEIDLAGTVQHSSRLYNLSLWSDTVSTGNIQVVKKPTGKNVTTFTNWLIIWDSHSVSVEHAVIWWGRINTVSVDYAAIGWWENNIASADHAVIGWWFRNTASQQNSVVVGWYGNEASQQNSVVVGWYGNTAGWKNSVVLWWRWNTARKNGLALWHSATSNEGSFAWNGTAEAGKWFIGATKWILVGTTEAIDWVNLVVDGAVKIAGLKTDSKRIKWEIRYIGKCFYAYDGAKWYVLNRWTEKNGNTQCRDFSEMAAYCKFGNTVIQNGDSVHAYSQPYAVGNCELYGADITCNNWVLSMPDHIYPYCYTIHN